MKNASALTFTITILFAFNTYCGDKPGKTAGQGALLAPGPKAEEQKMLEIHPDDNGGMTIRLFSKSADGRGIDPQSDLLIENEEGLKTGFNAITGVYYQQIPRSTYGISSHGDADTEKRSAITKELENIRPSIGAYNLFVIGTATGTYGLEITAPLANEIPPLENLTNVPTTRDEIHSYTLLYQKNAEKITSIKINKSNKLPSDTNVFLAYKAPIGGSLALPAGTTTFDMTILYGGRIIPSSFRAELNRVDVTQMFHPIPGGTEVVTLPLNKGSNMLTLSSEAYLNNRIADDEDRLGFEVEQNNTRP